VRLSPGGHSAAKWKCIKTAGLKMQSSSESLFLNPFIFSVSSFFRLRPASHFRGPGIFIRYKMTGRYVTRGLVEDEARQANFCFPGKSRNAFSNRRFFDIFAPPSTGLYRPGILAESFRRFCSDFWAVEEAAADLWTSVGILVRFFGSFFAEKKLKNSPLNLTVGGPLVGHAFFGQKLAKIFPEKGANKSPRGETGFSSSFLERIFAKIWAKFRPNPERVSPRSPRKSLGAEPAAM